MKMELASIFHILRYVIPSIAVLIVFAIEYIKTFCSKDDKFITKAKENGNYVTGNIIDRKFYYGNETSSSSRFRNHRIKVVYEYVVNGTSYKKKITFHSPGKVRIDYPNSVTVYYNPKNPSKGICKEEPAQSGGGRLVTIIIAIIVFNITKYLINLL